MPGIRYLGKEFGDIASIVFLIGWILYIVYLQMFCLQLWLNMQQSNGERFVCLFVFSFFFFNSNLDIPVNIRGYKSAESLKSGCSDKKEPV